MKSEPVINNIFFADPDFVLVAGDVFYAGRNTPEKVDHAMQLFERLASSRPFMPVIGTISSCFCFFFLNTFFFFINFFGRQS